MQGQGGRQGHFKVSIVPFPVHFTFVFDWTLNRHTVWCLGNGICLRKCESCWAKVFLRTTPQTVRCLTVGLPMHRVFWRRKKTLGTENVFISTCSAGWSGSQEILMRSYGNISGICYSQAPYLQPASINHIPTLDCGRDPALGITRPRTSKLEWVLVAAWGAQGPA